MVIFGIFVIEYVSHIQLLESMRQQQELQLHHAR